MNSILQCVYTISHFLFQLIGADLSLIGIRFIGADLSLIGIRPKRERERESQREREGERERDIYIYIYIYVYVYIPLISENPLRDLGQIAVTD